MLFKKKTVVAFKFIFTCFQDQFPCLSSHIFFNYFSLQIYSNFLKRSQAIKWTLLKTKSLFCTSLHSSLVLSLEFIKKVAITIVYLKTEIKYEILYMNIFLPLSPILNWYNITICAKKSKIVVQHHWVFTTSVSELNSGITTRTTKFQKTCLQFLIYTKLKKSCHTHLANLKTKNNPKKCWVTFIKVVF